MEVPPFVYAIFRVLHIFGGVVWLGFGLYYYFIVSRINTAMPAAAIHYQLGVAKHTRFGQIMGAASLVTTVAGLLLWGFGAHKMLTTAGMAILGFGTLTGLGAFGHGFGIGKRNDQLAKDLIAAEANGQIAADKQGPLLEAMARLSRNVNVSVGLMAITLLCMSTYSQF